MDPINSTYDEEAITNCIATALEEFYLTLIRKLDGIDMKSVFKSKNPYLYRAKSLQNAADIVDTIMQAYITSSEETVFGNLFFEPLAIVASGGQKSMAEGIDIDLQQDNVQYSIAVKSGIVVFNADSRKKQLENFRRSQRLATQGRLAYSPIIGYGYGQKHFKNEDFYTELAGEDFWTAMTGDEQFYKKIITYMGTKPEEYIDEYKRSYDNAKNRMVRDFTVDFCKEDGSIDWDKLVEFNSGSIDRQERERVFNEMTAIIREMRNDANISVNAISNNTEISAGRVKKLISLLTEANAIINNKNGRTNNWSIDDNTSIEEIRFE